MSIPMRNPYDEPESNSSRLLLDVLLLSLLAHAVVITAILLLSAFLPRPKELEKKPDAPNVTLSLVQPPKPIFIPTQPQLNTKHKQQLVESANDTVLKSKNQTARKPDSIMPDVTGKEHADALNNSPKVQAPPKPEVSSTPPTPKVAQPQKPTPPQPNPSQSQQPPQPAPKPQPPTPPTPAKPQPLVDENGLPLLPPINAPTLAPPNSAAPALAPSASAPQTAESQHGAIGQSGNNSPAAMASEVGKYKQYVHDVVGSYWYPDIDQHFGTIGVGVVHIQFTIHSDGKITDVIVLDGKGDNQAILRDISHRALISPAPYKPFTDSMIKQIGDSYTDDFSFSVY